MSSLLYSPGPQGQQELEYGANKKVQIRDNFKAFDFDCNFANKCIAS